MLPTVAAYAIVAALDDLEQPAMIYYFNIGETEMCADFDYKITSRGAPESGPSYWSGGEPAEPMEYEITVNSITIEAHAFEATSDNTKLVRVDISKEVDCPAWLKSMLETEIQESSTVYDDIKEESEHAD